jgi:hypothetical protein
MSDDNETPDGPRASESDASVPPDTIDSGGNSQESSSRNLADFDCPENAPLDARDDPAFDEQVGRAYGAKPLAEITDALVSADARANLDGATADGQSAVYLTGAFRFITPCHAAERGLRASRICKTCSGDLRQPVETAHALPCGHFTTMEHAYGDRKTDCPVCGESCVVRAEQVLVTRYISRPLPIAEQIDLFS